MAVAAARRRARIRGRPGASGDLRGRMSGGYGTGPLESLGGLARVTVGAWVRTASWGVGTSVRAARAAIELLDPSRLDDHDGGVPDDRPEERSKPDREPVSLRDRGAELLRQSADVEVEDTAHPAYARILEELHPDEARILRLLALDGRSEERRVGKECGSRCSPGS